MSALTKEFFMGWFHRSQKRGNNSKNNRGSRPAARLRPVCPNLEYLESRTAPAGFLITGPTPGDPAAIQSFSADAAGVISQASKKSDLPLLGGAHPAGAVAAGNLTGAAGKVDALAY